MNPLTTILVIVLSIGFTQGFVFSFLLWKSGKKDLVANRFKAYLLLVMSYGLLNEVLLLFGIGYFDTWYHLTLDLSWSYGPLLFLYVKAQSIEKFRLSRKDNWIFLPIVIQIICSIYVRSQNFFWDNTRESLTWLGYYGYVYWRNFSTVPIIASLLIIFYSYRSILLLNRLHPSEVNAQNLTWVKNLIKLFGSYYILVLLILVVDLVIYITTVSTDYYYFTRFYHYPFFIGIAILLYWFGISNVIRKDQRVLIKRKSLTAEEKSSLVEISEKLSLLMDQEEVFKDSTLTLQSLAQQLDIKPYLLTKTLNEVIHKSFNDYVNELRVENLKQLVGDSDNDKYTLLSLAYASGFNSKSSFNRAVKKHLGIAPSELKARS